jgi:integrase
MSYVKYYPEKRKNKETGELKTKNVPIFLSFSYDGSRLMYPTGEKIDLKYWNSKTQRVKSQVSGALEINNYLDKIKEKVLKIYREARIQDVSVTNAYLKHQLKPSSSIKKNVAEYFDQFILENQNRFTIETTKKLKSNLNHLKRFSASRHFKLEFDALDEKFFRMYLDYFYSLNHTNNTISKTIKNLKWFLNWCYENGYNKNLTFKKFKVQEYKGVIISLSMEELRRIMELKGLSKRLDQVRDVFVFGCHTGLRYSDLIQLKKEHVIGDYIKLRTIKTDSDVTIPIVNASRKIIDKYSSYPMSNLLPKISNQKMNQYLKEIGELAEIDEEIVIYTYRAKERIETKFKKFEKLTCHVSRRSFISIAFRNGMPTELIKSVSTHSSDEVFSLYNNISDDHKAHSMNIIFNNTK